MLADSKRMEIVTDVRMVASFNACARRHFVSRQQAKVQPVLQDNKDGAVVGAQS
jgi:hypothetical protein